MSNIKDFHETFLVIAACCLISILVICITILIDIRKKLIHEYWLVAIGILSAVFTASIQIILYFRRTGIFSGSTFAVGLILLLTFSVINTIHGIIVIERDKRDAVMASEAKGRFLANMSHEIRTPINAVLGMNAMILRESTEEPIREYAMDIRTAGQNLLSLINDILDFSKIESGKMELALVEYDFSSMIHDIMNMITVKAQSKDLYVELHIDAGLPSKLYGDDTRIRQILVNILNNAVKYTNEGGVTLTITGEPHEDRIRLHVSVADTGIGIKEEDISKLFAEFERIEESRNRNIEGTGLGMNITTQLLGLMDSKLEVHSVYGEGSVFSFDLEQRIVDAEPIGNLEERIQQQTQQFQYEVVFTAPDARVLVVDDNAVNRKVFVKLLKETRISIDAAASGPECIRMVQEQKYDAIFLDHMMPDMDGIETLHYLKELDTNKSATAPIIALTANAISGARELYLSEGFDDFLTKPIVPEKLEAMLVKHLPQEKVIKTVRNSQSKQEEEILELENSQKSKNELAKKDLVDIQLEKVMERLGSIPEMKLDYVQVLYGDGNDFLAQMQYFLDKEAIWMDELEKNYQLLLECSDGGTEEVQQRYLDVIRSMRISTNAIGACMLSGLSDILEKAIQWGRMETVKNVTPILMEEWRRITGRIREEYRVTS
jgi:signal transduction histidine kinase/DNA-binding response OmpR family regulator